MIGGELTQMSDSDLSLLTNKKLLTLLEDGWKPQQISRDDNHAIWKSVNTNSGETAYAYFNLSEEEIELELTETVYKACNIWEDDVERDYVVGTKIKLIPQSVNAYISKGV